jgi:endo-1,4-beta-xylanase
MIMKSEIRIPKAGRNPNSESRIMSSENGRFCRSSNFGFLLDFSFRISVLVVALLAGCATHKPAVPESATLKDTFKDAFLMGVAVNRDQFAERDQRGAAIVKTHFDSISSENILKWESVHPQPDRYEFEGPDEYVAFGEKNGMFLIGHTLVWHNQTPAWVFQDERGNPVDRETLLRRMRDHIHTVVGRYKGRIKGWDVVNEAILDDGTWRQTQWYKILDEEFVAKAFQFAHEADPLAELYYNDFALEVKPKRDGVLRLIRNLQGQGVPITGIGTQMHVRMQWPTVQAIDESLTDFEKFGLKIMVTELDVQVLPVATQYRGADLTTNAVLRAQLDLYPNGLPASVERAFTERYAEIFRVLLKHKDRIDRVTDADTWLNYWPVRPRTDYPLLFDRQGKPKPDFDTVIQTARRARN